MSYTTGEKALTPEQVRVLFECKTMPLLEEGLLRLGINGGLRRGDIVEVKQADLRSEDNFLSYGERKKKRTWQCYLTDETVKVLNQIRREYSSEWMFPGTNLKKHISSRGAYNILHRNLTRVGVPVVPFHALRATCVKLCQRAGWTPEQTAKHIGDSIRVVQEHYATPSMLEMGEIMQTQRIM